MFDGGDVAMPSLLGVSYLPSIRLNEPSCGIWTDLGQILGSIPVHSRRAKLIIVCHVNF